MYSVNRNSLIRKFVKIRMLNKYIVAFIIIYYVIEIKNSWFKYEILWKHILNGTVFSVISLQF